MTEKQRSDLADLWNGAFDFETAAAMVDIPDAAMTEAREAWEEWEEAMEW
ncbi:hypothetical protein [Roseixanthobacter pseudopolyaromaticivorans]